MKDKAQQFDETYSAGGIPRRHHVRELIKSKIKIPLPERFREGIVYHLGQEVHSFGRTPYRPSSHATSRSLLSLASDYDLIEEGKLKELEGRYAAAYKKHEASGARMLRFEADMEYKAEIAAEE